MNVSISDDYAVLDTKNYSFYFGYEFDIEETEDGDTREIWGFEVIKNDERIYGIPYDKMKKMKNCPSIYDCEECLLFGIGLFIEKSE